LNKFTVQADFTVHSVGLSVNSVGLSAKLAGWRFHCSNFESNEFQPIFTEFYQIRSIFSKTGSEETNSLVSTGFLNTGLDTVSHRSIRSPRLSLSAVLPPPPTRRALIPGPSHRRRLSDAQSWRASRHAPAALASHTRFHLLRHCRRFLGLPRNCSLVRSPPPPRPSPPTYPRSGAAPL
jgi:hypothetical protein